MADKVVLDVEFGGVEQSINSVKDLKNALKAAKDEQLKAAAAFGEGSKEFVQATKRVSDLKDKVEDLNDSTKSLKGSGVERASEGFNQLGEGLRNLDFDKVKVGLTAMKSALAAVGIGLIVQAVAYLVENFDSLSKGSGVLAKSLRFVGDIITDITDAIYAFTDAIGLTNTELDRQGEAIESNAEKATEALGRQTAEYDRQIAIAKASGKSAIDLEIAKQQAIIETNKALVQQTIEYVRNGGVLSEEQKKLLTGQLEAIKGAVTQQKVITLTAEKEKLDKIQKLNEDAFKKRVDEGARFKAQITVENEDQYNLEVENLARLEELRLAEQQKKLDEQAAFDAELLSISAQNGQAEVDLNKAKEEEKRAAQQETINQYTQATQQGLAAAQQITDLFFAYKLNKAKGDVDAENKIKKKAFQVNKAFGITNAVIDGIGAVQKALNNPYPLNIVLAAISGIAAAANIAKIASTKFEPSSGGGSGDAPASIPVPAPPTINTPSANTNQGTTFDETGKRVGGEAEKQAPTINVKATVGVDEITKKKDRVEVLEKQSTY